MREQSPEPVAPSNQINRSPPSSNLTHIHRVIFTEIALPLACVVASLNLLWSVCSEFDDYSGATSINIPLRGFASLNAPGFLSVMTIMDTSRQFFNLYVTHEPCDSNCVPIISLLWISLRVGNLKLTLGLEKCASSMQFTIWEDFCSKFF